MTLSKVVGAAAVASILAVAPGVAPAQPPPAPPGPGADLAVPPTPGATKPGESPGALRDRTEDLDDLVTEILTIPNTPAAHALDISDDIVARPADLREATAQLTSFVGDDGNLVGGLATELAPLRLLSERRTVEEWEKAGEGRRILDSVRVSIATSRIPDAPPGAAAALAAIGLRVSLIDQRDYRYNAAVRKAVRDTLAACFPPVTPGQGDEVEDFSGGALPPGCSPAKLNRDLGRAYTEGLLGHRLELAFASTFTASTKLQPVLIGSESDLRSVRAWLAWDYTAAASNTAGLSLETAVVEDLAAGQSGNMRPAFRGGAFVELRSDRAAWTGAAAYVAQGDGDTIHRALLGTSLSVELSPIVRLQASLHASCDDDACDAAVLMSIAVASWEAPLAAISRGR